jgi:DNA helicase-2/ATP-dependent DNA helicase PcrA
MQKYIAQQRSTTRTCTTKDGPMIIIAGAGSGKTCFDHKNYFDELGVDAFNILSLTFTNKAAREMKNVFLTLWAPAKLKTFG